MRIVVLFLAGCLMAQSSKPLLSVNTVTEVVKTSVGLSLDIAKFSSYKVEQSLPQEARKHYVKFTTHCQDYSQMVQEFFATNPVVANLKNVAGMAYEFLSNMYERANAQSAKIIDPVVLEFEKKYPSSAGLIGASLLDRLLVAVWLVWFFRTAGGLTIRLLGCKTCSKTKRNI